MIAERIGQRVPYFTLSPEAHNANPYQFSGRNLRRDHVNSAQRILINPNSPVPQAIDDLGNGDIFARAIFVARHVQPVAAITAGHTQCPIARAAGTRNYTLNQRGPTDADQGLEHDPIPKFGRLPGSRDGSRHHATDSFAVLVRMKASVMA